MRDMTYTHPTSLDSLHTQRTLNSSSVVVPEYEYVIAVYNEDLTWDKNIADHTHVYDKSSGKVRKDLEFFEWQNSNVGRESHTYLYHNIIENYDRLADVTVFLQGAINDHRREKILHHPKHFYEKLIAYVDDHPNPEEGHYLERFWATIFGVKK